MNDISNTEFLSCSTCTCFFCICSGGLNGARKEVSSLPPPPPPTSHKNLMEREKRKEPLKKEALVYMSTFPVLLSFYVKGTV